MKTTVIKEAGLKVTRPRAMILEILERSEKKHLSADDVFQILAEGEKEIGLGTVYRVLTQFEAAGIVKRHNFEDGRAVYELRQASHHDHLVCLECGRVLEFCDELVEKRQNQVAEEMGFEVLDHSHIIYGRCAACVATRTE